jgi:tRNA modification GTPase
MRTLKGVFSTKIHQLVAAVTSIRVNVEAAIDFSDEDIDIMTDTGVEGAMLEARDRLAEIFQEAQQGVLLKDGLNIVIAGAPNAGKSSLLNALAGVDAAIVTNIPGTTRDVLRQEISLAGLPMHIYDTAGMRESADVVEQEGVRRARSALGEADLILLVTDAGACDNSDIEQIMQPLVEINTEAGDIPQTVAPQLLNRLCVIFNKVDLLPDQFKPISCSDFHDITLKFFYISAKTGAGLEGLKSHLLEVAGFESTQEQNFSARERHLAALKEADNSLKSAIKGVSDHLQIELIAEDLRMVQQHLGAITGDVTSDDLLGEIFSSFCIGK